MTVCCLLIKHDLTCPGFRGEPHRCNCSPDIAFVSQAQFVEEMTRMQRRINARQKKKAAKRKGGAK